MVSDPSTAGPGKSLHPCTLSLGSTKLLSNGISGVPFVWCIGAPLLYLVTFVPCHTSNVSPRAFSTSLHVPPSLAITQLRMASWMSGLGCCRSEQTAAIRSLSASRAASLHMKWAMVWWRVAEPTCRKKNRIPLPVLSLEAESPCP